MSFTGCGHAAVYAADVQLLSSECRKDNRLAADGAETRGTGEGVAGDRVEFAVRRIAISFFGGRVA